MVVVKGKVSVVVAAAEAHVVMAADLVRIVAVRPVDVRMIVAPGQEAREDLAAPGQMTVARARVVPGDSAVHHAAHVQMIAAHVRMIADPVQMIVARARVAHVQTDPVVHALTARKAIAAPGPTAHAAMSDPEDHRVALADPDMMVPGMTAPVVRILISGQTIAGAAHTAASKVVRTLSPSRVGGSGFLPNQNPSKLSSVRSRPPAGPIQCLRWDASSLPGGTAMW